MRRAALDWLLTIAVAVGVVLVFEAAVAKPYRVPSASMEPTLHCARPADGCEAHFSDRVIACEICYRFASPHRGQVVVFHAPSTAAQQCPPGGTFVKRLIGLPGDKVFEDKRGFIWINGKKLDEPYIQPGRRLQDVQTNIDYRQHDWRVPKGDYSLKITVNATRIFPETNFDNDSELIPVSIP